MKTIYLISGPLGVGKSTVAKTLSETLSDSVLIVGDDLYNLPEDQDLEWEDKLRKGWNAILTVTKDKLSEHENVVIDFVVEGELPWIVKELKNHNAQIKYVVLIATRERLIERLTKRGEIKYKDRSFVLLDQLTNEPTNTGHFYDTTDKEIPEIVQEIINNPDYSLNP